MQDNVQQFLDTIQELKQKKFKVCQKSAGKDIQCQPLTFKQQKELIATVADGTLGVMRFQKILNDILLENTENDTLLISDKLPIILKLRCESVGDTLKFEDKEVSILENVKKAESIKFKNSDVIKGSVEVSLTIPSIKEENKIINHAIEVMKRDGDKDVGKNIGNIYTFEIVKFIESVKFGENELVFYQIPVRDRVKVVESLPLSINKQIVKFIESIKEIENDVLKVDVNGEEKSFDIDVSFFDN